MILMKEFQEVIKMKDEKGKIIKCPNCKKSDKIRLAGWIIRRGDMGAKKVQRYQCVNCGYSFTLDHIRRKKEKVK